MILKRTVCAFISVILSLMTFFGIAPENKSLNKDEWNTNYTYVFVHGLMGWGEYDDQYKLMPYWGMFGGDLMKYLGAQGYTAKAASVAPTSSAWDRACELYAQLTGTVTDYGKAHSEKYGHDRYGKDFTDNALIENWDAENKINLLGHSFGGATMRMLAHLMAEGSAEEREATAKAEISPLFTGGKKDYIYSLTALAAPHNGTTAYCVPEDESESILPDTAAFDMYIDNALELNKVLSVNDSTYYFSIPCSMTKETKDGTHTPNVLGMEMLFTDSSKQIGSYTGVTKGGYVIDESWQENDGLVNTVSAKAPIGNPSKDFDESSIQKGEWNIMPTHNGDHMSLQGGLMLTSNVKDLYVKHLSMINCL